MNRTFTVWIVMLMAGMLITGCVSTTTVKTTQHNPVIQDSAPLDENLLLDIGVGIFNPGVNLQSDAEEGVFLQVRNAEARFFPVKIVDTLQQSGNWGVVRLIPDRLSEMDIWIDGEILKSDGELLELRITVADSTGKTWYTRDYRGVASKYAYDNSLRSRDQEPFQGVYNDIANDLLIYRRKLPAAEQARIRSVTELRFARTFAPEIYGSYLAMDRKGILSVARLPADNDPNIERIRRIRLRDDMFIDTLQDYYNTFEQRMEKPYRDWRRMSYEENLQLRQLRAERTANLLGGIIAVAGGIYAQTSNNDAVETAGVVGIGAGAYAIKRGLDKGDEAKIHVQAIEELGTSLNAELEPHTMEVDNETVTLTGTVNEQYDQWKDILRNIYLTETGEAAAPPSN